MDKIKQKLIDKDQRFNINFEHNMKAFNKNAEDEIRKMFENTKFTENFKPTIGADFSNKEI